MTTFTFTIRKFRSRKVININLRAESIDAARAMFDAIRPDRALLLRASES